MANPPTSVQNQDHSHSPTDENLKHTIRGIPSADPLIIGLYGIPGSGKTHTLLQLKQILDERQFTFYEGSEVISQVVQGGLRAFEAMTDHEKQHYRQIAIEKIRQLHADGDKAAIVTGHYMFWPELDGNAQSICTESDLGTYTHILYLDIPIPLIALHRLEDATRTRGFVSAEHLHKWQEREKMELRQLCYDHKMLFGLIKSGPNMVTRIIKVIDSFVNHTEKSNRNLLENQLDTLFTDDLSSMSNVLMMDADRTLTDVDTGKLFWEYASEANLSSYTNDPLKILFSSSLGYSYKSFCQAALLYAESFDDLTFDTICNKVADQTSMYPQFVSFLRMLSDYKNTGMVIVTCGLRQIWAKILERENLTDKVKLIGSDQALDKGIVTAEIKEDLTLHMKHIHQKRVIAIGDSLLDLKMLLAADEAVVVVGHKETRSRSMEQPLADAIDHQNLAAKQVLLPSTVAPRLDRDKLPVIELNGHEFVDSLMTTSNGQPRHFQSIHATSKNAAKLLMTKTRDARNYGPDLKRAHRDVGRYLAIEFCTEIIGLERYPVPHVQGHSVDGHRLFHEKHTLIVALMRGGEPMASGVHKQFPEAMFLHAKFPKDINKDHLENCVTVILVDSVINTGKSIIEFCEHINKIHATVGIVIVTGVAQANSIRTIREESSLWTFNPISLVALRVSDNQYTGRGGTDTGNRLFNTTSLA